VALLKISWCCACLAINSFRRFRVSLLVCWRSVSPSRAFLGCPTLKTNALRSFNTSEITYPKKQRDFVEGLESSKYIFFYDLLLWYNLFEVSKQICTWTYGNLINIEFPSWSFLGLLIVKHRVLHPRVRFGAIQIIGNYPSDDESFGR
jgi:hypothetical protein